MSREEIERKLKKLKESNRKICIRCFIGEKFTKQERFAGGISGRNLEWYFDEREMIYNFNLEGNSARAYLSEIDIDLGWNEIVINYNCENF